MSAAVNPLEALNRAALAAIEERDQHDDNNNKTQADGWESLRVELRAAHVVTAELIASDTEYDDALVAYNECAPVRKWHSPAVAAELIGYRKKARARLDAAKARRAAALRAARGLQ